MKRRIIRYLLRKLTKITLKEQHLALGINSYIDVENDIHIVMLDYDTKDLDFVLNDLSDLSNFWNLSDYEIFKTMKGYHAFFWYERVPYTRLKMILDYSNCDNAYKHISKFYDYKTIRASGKYKTPDITFVSRYHGKRNPTPNELKHGTLKRKEYRMLKNIKFQDEWLK